MNAVATSRYRMRALGSYQDTDGRYYRLNGNHVEILCQRSGEWRLLRTASQPFIDHIRSKLK